MQVANHLMSLLTFGIGIGIIGHTEALKCYVQEEGDDFNYEESQCTKYNDKMCKMQNCDRQMSRGCGKCDDWEQSCNCQNCTENLCNGDGVNNLAIKCYTQRIRSNAYDYDYDSSDWDPEMKEKQCTGFDGKFCSTNMCDYNYDGATDYVQRRCGQCPDIVLKDTPCECHQCDTELCNKEPGLNSHANNIVGTLAILLVSLMFGKAVMEMTLI